jgi:hypothetical protein
VGVPTVKAVGMAVRVKNESDAMDVTAICEVAALGLFNLLSLRHALSGSVGVGVLA